MNTDIFWRIINQLGFDLPAFMLVILVHEFFHYMALKSLTKSPDESPLSFHPIKHFDILGTLLPICLVISGYPIVFGWGKRIEACFIGSPRRNSCEFLFSMAGMIGNLILCLVTGLFISIIPKNEFLFSLTTKPSGVFFYTFIFRLFSISLAVLLINLLPVPPFDGARLVFKAFGNKLKPWEEKLQILGLLIVVTIILTGLGGIIFFTPYLTLTNVLCGGLAPYVISPGTFSQDFLLR